MAQDEWAKHAVAKMRDVYKRKFVDAIKKSVVDDGLDDDYFQGIIGDEIVNNVLDICVQTLLEMALGVEEDADV